MKSASRKENLSVPVPASGKCLIRAVNGSIRCVGGDVDEIQVEATYTARGHSIEEARENVEQIRIDHVDNQGTAEIRAVVPNGIQGGVTMLVTMPPALSLDLQTKNGVIGVENIQGDVLAQTSNGGVGIVNVAGTIEAKSSNGKIVIEGDLLTRVNAITSNGAVTLAGQLAPGDHSIQTSNGTVEVDLRGGSADVTARTSNGKIYANGKVVKADSPFRLGDRNAEPAARMSIKTSNGSVRTTFVAAVSDVAEGI
ncbi:MAG: hypothetical protein WBD31_17490 [Rubripirellula sp.]